MPFSLRDMDRSPSFLQALETLTKEDYLVALQTLGRRRLFDHDSDYSGECYNSSANYPAFEATILCHVPDPNQDIDGDLSLTFRGLELSAVFLANIFEVRKEDLPLKPYFQGLRPEVLVAAARTFYPTPLRVLIQKVRDWSGRFPAFAAFMVDVRAAEKDRLIV
ncbi:MAG: hypothetical protein BGO12_05115 [Verrucomicrobia bacterium 61-8]|nr:MAG: hypothetical protein BGO12_05115 [Verrucomicrobia bacterium 61-8]